MKKVLLGASLAIVSGISSAGGMGPASSCQSLSCMPVFLEIGSGISWSDSADIQVNLSEWSSAQNGYNNKMGTEALYTAGIGYAFSPLISLDLSYTFRGIYHYKKYQISTVPQNQVPLGNRTRNFNLNSNAVMLNGTIYGQGWSDSLVYELGNHAIIQPILGGGVGVSFNTMSNFHTVLDYQARPGSVMQDNTKASFAWQLNAGLELKKDRFSMDAGYRYFDGGSFASNDAIVVLVDPAGQLLSPLSISPWTGKLSANELYITAKYAF